MLRDSSTILFILLYDTRQIIALMALSSSNDLRRVYPPGLVTYKPVFRFRYARVTKYISIYVSLELLTNSIRSNVFLPWRGFYFNCATVFVNKFLVSLLFIRVPIRRVLLLYERVNMPLNETIRVTLSIHACTVRSTKYDF